MRVLAIDQGTTSTRGVVFEGDAPPMLVASFRHRQFYPQPGWVEHDPLEILANITGCIERAGHVDAIGLANQGESCLAWDRISKEPLSPIIVWQDSRTDDMIARLKADGAEARVRDLSGLPLESYFSASKLAWLIERNGLVKAALRERRLRLGTTDSFWLDRLTGAYATDPTTASRTGLMNLAALEWDETLCTLFGVPIDILAPIHPTTGVFGGYKNIPVKTSVVDQQAALFGHGCRHPGDAKITFGTGAFALALAGEAAPSAAADGLISTVAWQSTMAGTAYAVEGGLYDAGAAIEWAKRIGLVNDFAELQHFEGPPAIGQGLVFVPALSGLACPQWDRNATAVWLGMTNATTRRDLQRSILEGIALQTREVVVTLDQRIKLGATLRVDGGLSASGYFMQFLADVTDKTVLRSENAELTAYGCALLAGHPPGAGVAAGTQFIGRGVTGDWVERYAASVRMGLAGKKDWGNRAGPPKPPVIIGGDAGS
jgi:glycerol kinase